MPLFGSKKEKKGAEGSGPPAPPPPYNPAYSGAAYPTQAAAPSYQQPPPYQNYQQPQSYSAQQPQGYPNPQPQAYQPVPPPAAGATGYYIQGAPPQYAPVQKTVVAQGAYDPGARFDGVAQPNVPPPPPGVMPNAAQIAQAQGHQVVATQQKAGWFDGGQGGGYTIW